MDLWLDDPDPRIRELAMIAFLDGVYSRSFLLRWAKMNDCEEWMHDRLWEIDRASYSLTVLTDEARKPASS